MLPLRTEFSGPVPVNVVNREYTFYQVIPHLSHRLDAALLPSSGQLEVNDSNTGRPWATETDQLLDRIHED